MFNTKLFSSYLSVFFFFFETTFLFTVSSRVTQFFTHQTEIFGKIDGQGGPLKEAPHDRGLCRARSRARAARFESLHMLKYRSWQSFIL